MRADSLNIVTRNDLLLIIERLLEEQTIPASDLIKFINIANNYFILEKKEYLSLNEVMYLLNATLGSKISREKILLILNKIKNKSPNHLCDEIFFALRVLELQPGKSYPLKFLHRYNYDKKILFEKLLIINILFKNNKYNKIIVKSKKDIITICNILSKKGYSSLDNAVANTPVRSRDDVLKRVTYGLPLSQENLALLSRRELLSLGEVLAERNRMNYAKVVGRELADRLMRGEKPEDPSRETRLLRELGLLTPRIAREYLQRGFLSGEVSPSIIASSINGLPFERASELVSRTIRTLRSREELMDFLSNIDLAYLARAKVPNYLVGDERVLFQAAVFAARAMWESLNYLSSRDPGRADAAYYYSERAKRLVESIASSGSGPLNKRKILALASAAEAVIGIIENPALQGSLDSYLYRFVRLFELSELLSILRNIYNNIDNSYKSKIIEFTFKIIERYAVSSGLSTLASKSKNNAGRGRFLVRESIYNSIRFNPNPLVFLEKRRAKPIAVLVDTSGSMKKHSDWALVSASLFYRNIEVLAAFSTDYSVLKKPFNKSDFGGFLLSTRFGGRTNISRVLKDITNIVLKSKKIIVISDLAHNTGEPLEDAVADIVKRGFNPVFIVPASHDFDLSEKVKAAGARVIVASSPVKTARSLLREALK